MGACVLIVDDEKLDRHSAIDVVEDAGLVALGVDSIVEAVRILESGVGLVAVIVGAEMLRGTRGERLLRLLELRDEISVLLSYAENREDGMWPRHDARFRKPYDGTSLARALQAFTRQRQHDLFGAPAWRGTDGPSGLDLQ